MAGAGAGDGIDGRTGDLHPPLAAHPQGVLEHRRSHRGRCAGDRGGARGADGGAREDGGRRRGAGAGRMTDDVAIVGGGMVGASLAVALAPLGLKIVLIEAVAHDSASQPSFDERTTALSNASRRILETLGVWRDVQSAATPIRKIHVSDRGRFGFARIDAAEQGLQAMGYVVPNRALGAALWSRLQENGSIRVHCPAQVSSVAAGAHSVQLQVAGTPPSGAAAGSAVASGAAEGSTAAGLAIDARLIVA